MVGERSNVKAPALLAALILGASLIGCSGNSGGAADHAADTLTKSVYANDYHGTLTQLDSATQKQVTRASVGAMSDMMHRLGTYNGLTLMSADPAKNEFTYKANFEHGSLNVALRLDTHHGVAAYHVFATP